MFTIDVSLKNTPMPVAVQRKEAADAENLYKEIMEAMRYPTNQIIELTCEKEEGKKVAVRSDLIAAVMISQKSGAAASGRVPGFFAAPVEK
ncbi:MAG: hypothetical protein DSM107014_05010 [Gomphosphaeria aponina SAG 52.96 = DSM 107014]|uniref:Uncharacterized protein n=1 Tax=Gomphosphaeria aponina SAG 52.96 = DSM 107014 TaxID=1521640 RepID=A0A941GPM8_9CHRO|nr:hypothetical protein [Gomphosphaeria aponina SAG 52.96 = DSM 107014]